MTIDQIMEVQRNNIENIIYSSGGLSPHEKCVVLYDMLKCTINKLLNEEIDRKKGMKIEVPTLKEYPDKYKQGDTIELNSETVPIAIHNALYQRDDYKVGYNQAIDEDITHLTSLKELIK